MDGGMSGRWVDGQIDDGWVDGCGGGWMMGKMEVLEDVWLDGELHGEMNEGGVDGQMDERMMGG